MHAEQSTVESASHNVPPLPSLTVGVPLEQVHVFGRQLVSSFGLVVSVPSGHEEQESVFTNGLSSGDDMYLLAGQHPYLAVLVPRVVNAFSAPAKDSHVLPHNVRLNPLSLNTADYKK